MRSRKSRIAEPGREVDQTQKLRGVKAVEGGLAGWGLGAEGREGERRLVG